MNKAYYLKFVANAQTQAAGIYIITECCTASVIAKCYTEGRTEVQRELEREPEVVLNTETTGCTNET